MRIPAATRAWWPNIVIVGRALNAWMLFVLAGGIHAIYPVSADESEITSAGFSASDFQSQLAPAVIKKCVACHHGPEAKGSLDVTTRAGILAGGDSGPAMIPGDPDHSPFLLRTISQEGAPPEMPEQGEPLNELELAALRHWIEAGAPWPEGFVLQPEPRGDAKFWSFQPISTTGPPEITTPFEAWGDNPIDRFTLAQLHAEGLEPNPPATAAAFIRRASYDLTGLPPDPQELAAFESAFARNADQAVHELIDRLLASPRYGEHWGRHWLDVIRFGESRGYERNEIITNLWPFRDYVIRSFNEDKSFRRFLQEHLAGDVLAPGNPEIEVGSAFLVAGPYDDVGNQNPEAAARIRADQMDEMIRATSEAFLGLSVGCARCHDHKFDPITAADYYALYATFAGTTHGQREVASEAIREAREKQLAPLEAARKELQRELDTLDAELAARIAKIAEAAARGWTRSTWSRYGTEEQFSPIDAKQVRLVVEGTDSEDDARTQFTLDEFEVWSSAPTPINVALAREGAEARGSAPEAEDFAGAYSARLTIDGNSGERWVAIAPMLTITFPRMVTIDRVRFSSDRTQALKADHELTTFVGDYRIEVSLDGEAWTTVASSDDRVPPTAARKNSRLRKLVLTEADRTRFDELKQRLAAIEAELSAVPPLPTWWVGTHAEAPGPFHILIGGSPEKKGAQVSPAGLSVWRGENWSYELPGKSSEGERRLALANWLSPDHNPLTARVLVNRIWHYHFGRGIVDTPSDFGFMGGRPTHPELLDWLAEEARRQEWRWKPLHRLIMNSRTYRQSADWRMDASAVDAENRWLWRFSPRRISAEELRDTLLDVSGALDLTMGGPGYRLYDYQQDNVATYVPKDQFGPETYRRAVYHHNARAARVDLMSEFDCPDSAFGEPRRSSTTTPLQALTLLNHSFTLKMAEAFAARLRRECPTAEQIPREALLRVWGREPAAEEISVTRAFLEAHGLFALGRALFNSNEFLRVE